MRHLKATGALWLVLCLASPLSAQLVLDIAAGDARITLNGEEEGGAGWGLAVGDLNGDTIPDLAVGAPSAGGPAGDRLGAGAVYVIFDAASLSGTYDLATEADFILWGAVGDPDGFPPYQGDGLGSALLAADLNGDTLDDLAAGAPRAAGPMARTGAGVVEILLGPLSAGSLDLSAGSADHTLQGADAGDALGGALAAGAYDAQPGMEMFAGAVGADGDGNAFPESGESYLTSWNPLPGAVVDLATDPVLVQVRGEDQGDAVGFSLLVKDLVGDGGPDGRADLVVGAVGVDGELDDRSGAGGVYVLDARFIPPFPVDLGPGVADITYYGARQGDAAGTSLTAPDWNGDTLPDLAIGAPGGDGPGPAFNRTDAGQVHVSYFTPSMPLVIDLLTDPIQTRIFGAEDGDRVGLAADGNYLVPEPGDSLAIGIPFADGPGITRRNAGAAAVLGPQPGQPLFYDLRTEPPDLLLLGGAEEDRLGFGVCIHDLTGNGQGDLVASAPTAPVQPDRPGAGVVYLFPRVAPSIRPTAVAAVPPWRGCATGGTATVPLDGSNSFDPDSSPGTNDDIVAFDWYEGIVSPGNEIATGEITSADLPLGSHDIILRVEDTGGLEDTDSVTVEVSEASAEVTGLRLSRPFDRTADLDFTWNDAACADTYRIFRGTLIPLPPYDHQSPFTGDPGMAECSAASGVGLPGEGTNGFNWFGLYYLVGGVNAPAGSAVVGALGAGDLDGNGWPETLRPRPGEPGATDTCP